MIHKTTKTILRTLAFALTICATGGAWAEVPTPTVIWDGDFSSLSKTVGDVTYTINNVTATGASTTSANSVGGDKSYLQVANSDSGVVAPTVTASGGSAPFGASEGSTVLIFVSNMPLTEDSNRALLSFMDNTTGPYGSANPKNSYVRFGIARAKGTANNTNYGGNYAGGFISAGAIEVNTAPVRNDAFTDGKQSIALTYKGPQGTFKYYVDGQIKGEYNPGSSFTTPTGICIGGLDYTGSRWFYAQKSMKIHTIAIFDKELTAEEIAEYESQSKWRYFEAIAWRNTSGDFHQSTFAPVSSISASASSSQTRQYNTSENTSEFPWAASFTSAKCPIAIFYDVASKQQEVGGDFDNLNIGGLYVTATPSSDKIYTLTGKNANGTRETFLGDKSGNHESWFVFKESYKISRGGSANTGDSRLYGAVNMEIDNGKEFTFNSEATTSAKNIIMTAGTSNTAAPELRMTGGGQFTVNNLNASTGKLDYSALDPSGQATTPFINGTLTVSENTTYAFPALSGAATYRVANAVSADATYTSAFTIDGNEYTAPLTFSASAGTVSFPAVATLAAGSLEVANAVIWPGSGVMSENLSWDAKPDTISSTTAVAINVTDDTLFAPLAAISVKSLTFNISEGKTLALYPSFPISTTDGIIVKGGGTLRICEETTINGGLTFTDNSTITFDANKSLAVNGSLTVSDGKTLTLAPQGLSSVTTQLLSASSISGTVSVSYSSLPATYNYTYDVTSTSATIHRVIVPSKTYTAAVGNWTASGWGSFGNASVQNLHVGPNETWSTVFEVSSDFNPYISYQAPSDTGWSYAVYADVSKMSDSTSSRPIIAAFGNYDSATDALILYREGASVKLRRQKNNNPVADWAASVPVLAGFHLYTFTCDPTTGKVSLYVDAGGEGKVSSNANDSSIFWGEMTLTAGFQLGSTFGANPDGFVRGDGMAIAAFNYYDAELNAEEVALLADQYPATDGTKIYGQVDNLGAWNNKQNEDNNFGSAITVYSGAYPDDTETGKWIYLGISSGTLTIPSGETVRVPFFKTCNKSSAAEVTVDILGDLIVTSTADSNIYEANKGILLGHYSGTGTYNITGSLVGRNTYLMGCFSAGDQAINVSGGLLAVKGFSMRNGSGGNATITLTNNGTVEVAAPQTLGSKDVIRNFGYGTYRVVADYNEAKTITFTSNDSTRPTTLDPYGNTLTMADGSMSGTGYVTVGDNSDSHNGTVVFGSSASFSGYVILTDANAANVVLAGYTGKVLLRGTAAATLAKLNGFAGAVIIDQAGTYDARSVDLSSATVTVQNAGAVLLASAGQEGSSVVVMSGALRLYLSNDQFLTDGYVFGGLLNTAYGASLTYYHGEARTTGTVQYEAGAALSADELEVVQAGSSIAPYYKIFAGDETGTAGRLSILSHWANGPENLPVSGNIAIHVTGGKTLTIDIDNSPTFGEVLVFGSGAVVFTGSTGTMTVTRGIYAMSGTQFSIQSGVAENVSVYALDLGTVAMIDCGTEANPFDITHAGSAGYVMVNDGRHVNFASAGVENLVVNGTANIGETDGFRVNATLSVGESGTLNFNSTSLDCSYMRLALASGGAVNATGATLAFNTLDVPNGATVSLDSTSSLSIATATGAGRVEYAGKLPDRNGAWTTGSETAGWRGTVAVSGYSSSGANPWYVGKYGNTYSTLEVDNCYAYYTVASSSGPALKLVGAGLKIANGNSSDTTTYAALSGSGALVAEGGPTHMYKFATASEFTGSITNTGRRIVFGTSSPDKDANSYSITLDSGVTAGLGDGATWDSSYIYISGTLDVKGVGKLKGNVVVNGEATVINLSGSPLSVVGTLAASDATWTIGGTLPGSPTKSTPVTLITGLTAEPSLGTVTVDGLSAQHTVYAVEDSGTYNVVVRLKDDEWNSDSATTWTTTSFNGSSDYSDGMNVSFGAIDGVAAKTVTISGTVAPGAVAFNSTATAYTLTGGMFTPGGTVTIAANTSAAIESAATGTYYVNSGATLTLTNATVTSVSGAGTLHIPAGGVVTISAESAITSIGALTGTGTLLLNGVKPTATALQNLLKANGWQGTFAVVNVTDFNAIDLHNWGNANSKVRLTGVTGYPNKTTTAQQLAAQPELILENGTYAFAFKTTNGWSYSNSSKKSSDYYSLFRKISGSGKLLDSKTVSNAYPTQLYVFNDATNFTGSIGYADEGNHYGKIYLFSSATVGNLPDAVTSDDATTFEDGKVLGGTIDVWSANSVVIGDGSEWAAPYGIRIAGTVEMQGDATMANAVTLSGGATLKFDAANGTTAPLTIGTAATWPASDSVTLDISALPPSTIRVPLIKRTGGAIANFDASRVTVVPPAGSSWAAARWTTYVEDGDGGTKIYGVMVKPGTIFSVY